MVLHYLSRGFKEIQLYFCRVDVSNRMCFAHLPHSELHRSSLGRSSSQGEYTRPRLGILVHTQLLHNRKYIRSVYSSMTLPILMCLIGQCSLIALKYIHVQRLCG